MKAVLRAIAVVAFAICVHVRAARAQFRINDALTLADVASGSLSSLTAACDGTTRSANGGVAPSTDALMEIPGSAPSATKKSWYFSASAGAAVFNSNSAGRDGNPAGVVVLRAHFVPPTWCRVDGFLAVHSHTGGAVGGTAEARVRLWPGSQFAPTAEIAFMHPNGAMDMAETPYEARYSARIAASTPNLYALTVGRVSDAVFGAKSPKLDVRARLFLGTASYAGFKWACVGADAVSMSPSCWTRVVGGGQYSHAGGTLTLGLLHVPVSLLVTSEHIAGDLPVGRPRARDALGLAFRTPGSNRDLWIVARAERNRDRGTTMTYRIELAHLMLGSW